MQHLTSLSAASMPRGAAHPVFSPDGTLLRYEVGADTCIWDVARGRPAGRFLGHQSVWSADSDLLAFVRDGQIYAAARDGSSERVVGDGTAPCWRKSGTILHWTKKVYEQVQLLRTNVELMTAPEQITQIIPKGPWALSPDGHWLAYIHADPNANRLAELPEFAMQIGSFPDRPEVRVIDLANDRRFIVDSLLPGAEVLSLAWSPGDCTLAYGWQLIWNSPGLIQRHVCLWQPGEKRPEVVDVGEFVSASCPAWSPDGSRLALLVNPWGHFTTNTFGWLAVFDVTARTVCWQCRDVAANPPIIWSPDGSMLYCRLGSHTEQPYVVFSAEEQLLRRITPEGHYSSSASLSSDGTQLAVSARSFSGLNEIWLCPTENGALTRITSESKILGDLALSRVWTHRWITADGLTFDGIVIEPEREPSPESPILLFPMVDERGWNITNLEPKENCGFLLHWMAQRGYRVFIPSHRLTGLVGLQHLTGQFRPFGAVADIVAGVNSLRERLGTKARVVAFGQSVGGDLTCEILVSYPDLLAAAVVSGIQPDFMTLYSTEATPNPMLRETFGGPPWERPQEYLEASPIRGVRRVEAPILILMGSGDTSCINAEQFYVALSEAGKDVAYLQFQNQGHWPEEPEQVAAYVETAIQWLDKKITSSLKEKL